MSQNQIKIAPVVSRKKKTYVVILAALAVGLWSVKPILITVIGDHLRFAETYILSAIFSLLASFVILLFARKTRSKVMGSIDKLGKAIAYSAISGVFLAVWYYGFYRALMEGGSSTSATVIAFSWPLISVIAIRMISKGTHKPLKSYQWLLLISSFVGVSIISMSNISLFEVGGNKEILWACVAALGSGLYLPFSMKASSSIELNAGIEEHASVFISIFITNVVSLIVVVLGLTAFKQDMDFSRADTKSVLICALIGIGIYLIAEVSWTWAMKSYGNLALASLPYFSPAISVVLLFLIFNEPVSAMTFVGMILILASNMAIHITKKES